MLTLDEAAAAIPPKARLHLALPCDMALLERLTLPATNREELSGMAQLQLEKTLPYPVEEASSDVQLISQAENESTVLSIAVNTDSLSRFCEPLRSRQRVPRTIHLFAQNVATICPRDETVLAVWKEQENLALGIFENRALSWIHTSVSAPPEEFESELSGLMLQAEMDGATPQFSRVLVSAECASYSEVLKTILEVPVEQLSEEGLHREQPAGNLLPPSWADESLRVERDELLRSRLTSAAFVYLLLVAAAFVYLAVAKRQAQKLAAQVAALQPALQDTVVREKRWATLGPALDMNRYALEVLQQVYQSRPSPESHLTNFDFSPASFKVDGEAPKADQAVEYEVKLRDNKDLKFQISSGSPKILPDGRAQFSFPVALSLAAYAGASWINEPPRDAYVAARYSQLMADSPFALATPTTAPPPPERSFAEGWSVIGLWKKTAPDGTTIEEAMIRTSEAKTFTLAGHDADPDGVSISAVKWSDKAFASSLTLKKGSEFANIEFIDPAQQTPPQAASPMAAMRPGLPRPGMPSPPPAPSRIMRPIGGAQPPGLQRPNGNVAPRGATRYIPGPR